MRRLGQPRFRNAEYLVAEWSDAGLLFPSVLTGILRTIKRAMIHRRLDSMPLKVMREVDRALRRPLDL